MFWSSGVRPLGTRGEFIIKRIAAVDCGTDQASTGPHSDCVMFTLSSQLSRIERSYIGTRRRRNGGKARNWIVCTAESLNGMTNGERHNRYQPGSGSGMTPSDSRSKTAICYVD